MAQAGELYALDPALPVLLRPDGAVQVGWSPRRAVLIRPPRDVTATGLATLLRSMHSPLPMSELQRRPSGLSNAELSTLIGQLVTAGVVTRGARHRATRSASIRVHGRGPLSDLLAEGLRGSGAKVKQSNQPHAATTSADTDLVVLSDNLVADPRILRELHAHGVAHLAVRVRDGIGLVGPLVVPGVTSCLHCADLHRRDRDAAWPTVVAQLRDTVGVADRATLLATAALALSQVNRVIRAVRGVDSDPPISLSTTLEFDVHSGSIVARQWPKHPLCSC
ncbi:cyclodehydratase [Mycobacterium sp. 1245111.1]|uniref:cyclodehydratase n=1 Tax=Mycobacterium sp. 1245111.1 TaxID=1834073 RepID=UPI0007FCF1A6|nr:cyclodehydratase [Mycobacterium sp. 1245111.1]OBK36572.1 cyclodehydratase [Mycobacterium sp. 1245111.1]